MARIGTGDNWDIGLWTNGENPGAGNQTTSDYTEKGLNGNWKRLWRGVKDILDGLGDIKANVIKGTHLKQTSTGAVVDESSLEFSSDKMRIKADGVQGTMLNVNCADASTLEVSADKLQIKDAGVTGAKLNANAADATSLEVSANVMQIKDLGVTTAKINTGAVTNTKIGYDNTRCKQVFIFTYNPTDGVCFDGIHIDDYGQIGIPMPRAGYVTRCSVCADTGAVVKASKAYGSSGYDFEIDERLTLGWGTNGAGDPLEFTPAVVGTPYIDLLVSIGNSSTIVKCIILVEVEFT